MSTLNQELEWVERLARTLTENKLHKIEFETEDASLTLRAKRVVPVALAKTESSDKDTEPDVAEEDVTVIRSKEVGIFHPAAKLQTGESVTTGQKLGTIEAVSVEHELLSDCTGTLVEVVLADGDPVEYGQPLFVVSESEG